MERQQKEWNQLKHEPSKRTDVYNLIRSVLEKDLKVPADLKKPLINLGLGEPSKANGFELPEVINEAMIESIKGETANGYTMSSGTLDARKAIVKKFSNPEFPFTVDDVVLSFGCSGAIYNAVSALCEEGDNILVPRPGFPLCYPISQNLNINLKYYDLLPEQGWEIDLNSLKSQIDENTKAILVNNPSNPCGSCFTKAHSLEILAVANEYKVPIISDEVYYGLAYGEGSEFNSFGNLTKDVPIIVSPHHLQQLIQCCSSISKIYCLPGWRLGWSIVYNNHGYFDHVIQNLHKHAMIQLHPNSLVQQALPRILGEVGEDHFTTLKNKLKEAAECAFNRLSQIRGLQPIKPSAAMYMMIKISLDEFCDIEDDVDFCKKMLHEESILAFPAQCFFAKDAFRIVICQSTKNIEEFADRLQDFCQAHYKRTAPLVQDQ